ncbi:hypothetical protein SAMN02787076_03927 [Rhizobacter sp. OV335]|nr:hypothetical protein SAMN02787076_03927 [Rhizobacter sp. OV335]
MPAPNARMLAAEGGRFVFGQISDYRADQFLLDTKTGRLWQIVLAPGQNGDSPSKRLQIVPFIAPDDKLSLEPR